jgi:hypothetical protein
MRDRLLLASLVAVSIAAGGPHVYRNDQARVRAFAPPAGWELAPQASYPRLLAAYLGAEGAKLTLAGQKLARDQSALSLAEEARPALEKQGFTKVHLAAEGERARVEAELDGGKRFLKQLYVVDGGWAYVITMVAPTSSAAHTAPDFDEAVRSLQIAGSTGPAPPPQP